MRVIWTPALDEALLQLRWAGRSWDAIAGEMGLGRNSVLERGRRLGARRQPMVRPVVEDADRPPRPAGHPISWGAITGGTVLEGCAYPFPVFL